MLSGVLRRRAAAEWALPWGGRFLRELSFFAEGSAPSGRHVSNNSAATSVLKGELASALNTSGVRSSVNQTYGSALKRPLEITLQSKVRWGLSVSRPAVEHSPFLESASGVPALEMFLEAPSHGLSPPAVFDSIQTVAAKSTRALSIRPPLPPSGSAWASHDTFRTLFRGASSKYLSSSSLTSPSPFSSQPLRTARATCWKVAGARSHYTRFLGDDGDQLVDPPEAADLVPTAHTGPPVPLHSYPNAMMPFLASPPPLDAVVKIFTVTSSPNYFLPWQNKPQREVSGSGFVISGQRILTNAHVVANQTFVLVRKHGTSTKYRAEVEAVGHECDLAVLKVPNDDFWEGMHPLEFGEIPQLQEQVAVVGYPQGGDNISVTAGVVSRVELTQYAHGAGLLLAVQIDAAINPGNSGGPAVMDFGSGGMNSNWKVVGVAFQNLREADSIGYIIPVPVIQHFLEDVQETGHYVGFCGLGLSCQQLENAQLRDHLGMRPGMTGVLVNRVQSLTDSHNHIRKDDVLMAFDGVPIANDGTVSFRKRERISFDHLVAMKKAGETAVVKVLRDGKELDLEVEVNPVKALVPIHQYDKLPSYFIFAGLVFVPLTQPYLHEYGDDWYNTSPRRLCERAMRSLPTQEGEQMVILSQVLIDDINSGYQTLADLQVKKVNGIDVRNLRHLRRLVEGCTEKHVRFDLDDERVMVLNFDEAKRASEGILSRHRIPSHISEDLMEDRFGDSGDAVDSTWPDRVAEHWAIPVGNRTSSKL